MEGLNLVVIQGNLTRDPELRQLASGTSVCGMRVAVNERIKDRDSGQWSDRANYFDVTVWGAQGENCNRYLTKGSGVIVQGRLRWREWEATDGTKRQAVDINADKVRFMGAREGGSRDEGNRYSEDFAPPSSNGGDDFTPAPARQPAAAPAGSGPPPQDDDDIPF